MSQSMGVKTNPRMNSKRDRPVRLLMEVAEGRVASAILNNGFLNRCVELGAEVKVVTPGVAYPPFIERYKTSGVSFEKIAFDTPVRGSGRLNVLEKRFGERFLRKGWFRVRRMLWKHLGSKLAERDLEPSLLTLLDDDSPDVFFTADVNMGFGRAFVGACQRRGIPTVGNIFSWDHPYYPHLSRPDTLTCWSPFVKDGLVSRSGFLPSQIKVTGAPAYDAYVDNENAWSRERLCRELGLESDRPIILFASLGQFKKTIDETDACRALLEEIDAGRIGGRPQVILRLHPDSKELYWSELLSRSDVCLSRYLRSCPGMRWWPSREEVVLTANILRHADVCLSPGSTMAIEPAIFDTPTIVPLFNRFMPEEYGRFFDQFWMNRHFRFLAERKLLPFARSVEEMSDVVNRALADRSWMSKERRIIREELFGPLDGRSTERLAEVVVEVARGGDHD